MGRPLQSPRSRGLRWRILGGSSPSAARSSTANCAGGGGGRRRGAGGSPGPVSGPGFEMAVALRGFGIGMMRR
uniref:Uncharacterized protein n=1 Tax=Arundo donax TaxID=35708 RepID=A0A0A9H0Y6_ARUDO